MKTSDPIGVFAKEDIQRIQKMSLDDQCIHWFGQTPLSPCSKVLYFWDGVSITDFLISGFYKGNLRSAWNVKTHVKDPDDIDKMT